MDNVINIANLVLPSIRKLERLMTKGEPLDPQAAHRTKKSLDALLDVIEVVCENHHISFPEVLAHLSPVEDLLIWLSFAANRGASTDGAAEK